MRFRASVYAERVVFKTAHLDGELRALARHVAKAMRKRVGRAGGPSRPGQAPRRQRGVLRRSVKIKKLSSPRIGYYVGPRKGGSAGRDGFFARFLQFGTRNLAARPFVDETIDAERGYIERRLTAAVRAGIQGER